MLSTMSRSVNSVATDFLDLRREVDRSLTIALNNGEVKSISDNRTGGYFARAIVDGGLAARSFPLDKDLKGNLDKVAIQAKLTSKYRQEKCEFAPAAAVVDTVRLSPKLHPDAVPMEEKVELLRRYAKVVSAFPKVVQCELVYVELHKDKLLVTGEGTKLDQQQLICYINGRIVARDGSRMEDVRVSIGGTEDFANLKERDEVFESKARIATELLSAKQVESGIKTVLLNPMMTGLFIHEAFGHFSEADLVAGNPELLSRMPLGTEIAYEKLNVIDDGNIHGAPGWWVYDEEGVPAKKTRLISDGVLTARMHSRETAAQLGEPLSGNAVAQSCRHVPLVRMSNIYVVPGDSSFEELLSSVESGLYACDSKGGQTMGDQYSFGAQYGYEIENGKLGKMVCGINLSGNLFSTLKNIRGIGDSMRFREVGGCGKGGQINVKSGLGGPDLLADGIIVG